MFLSLLVRCFLFMILVLGTHLFSRALSECLDPRVSAYRICELRYNAHDSLADATQISLLVLDEIHHCMKAHPYRQIMRDFYQFAEPNSRPKVFGMTASPIWNGKQGDVDLQALEQNTYCMVYRVSKNISELDAHTHTPSEVPGSLSL
jgi:hypothetical protein